MSASAGLTSLVERLRLYGHQQRLTLLRVLLDAECSVSELEERSGVRQPALSQQLGELRHAGAVEARSMGKHRIYRLAEGERPRVVAVLGLLEARHDDALPPGNVEHRLTSDRSGALFPRMLL